MTDPPGHVGICGHLAQNYDLAADNRRSAPPGARASRLGTPALGRTQDAATQLDRPVGPMAAHSTSSPPSALYISSSIMARRNRPCDVN